jgi:FixJ family two-component response regulator
MDDPTVYVVDDDESVRNALQRLLSSHKTRVEAFSSGTALLESCPLNSPACIVMDVRMPMATGMEVQEELARRGVKTPVIFLTGHATVPTSVRAMKSGAVDFLSKPVDKNDLMSAVYGALNRDRQASSERAEARELKERYASLSRRERQVLHQVALGRLNKQIAHDLDISETTVKVHRSQVMAKMQASSVAQLVRMVDRLGPGEAER